MGRRQAHPRGLVAGVERECVARVPAGDHIGSQAPTPLRGQLFADLGTAEGDEIGDRVAGGVFIVGEPGRGVDLETTPAAIGPPSPFSVGGSRLTLLSLSTAVQADGRLMAPFGFTVDDPVNDSPENDRAGSQ